MFYDYSTRELVLAPYEFEMVIPLFHPKDFTVAVRTGEYRVWGKQKDIQALEAILREEQKKIERKFAASLKILDYLS